MNWRTALLALVNRHSFFLLAFFCSAIILFPLNSNGWLNWDDYDYVLENSLLNDFTFKGITQLFSQNYFGNYHPLTLLVYAIIKNFFGENPQPYHSFIYVLHLINTLLVYGVSRKLKMENKWAALLAFLFAIHPMHLESIAWISSLKDVLYVFFMLLSILTYMTWSYKKQRSRKHYFLSLGLFLCALLAKGMAVVLPLILLLIDSFIGQRINIKNILNKLPFFLLSLLFGLLAIYAQSQSNAIADFNDFSLGNQMIYASYAFLLYLVKAIVPFQLAIFHPYPINPDGSLPNYLILLLIPMAALLILFWYWLQRDKHFRFGILFFLISIFPVLQLLAVGNALIAERYTYFSYLGLFYILVYLFSENYSKVDGLRKRIMQIALGVYLFVLMGISFQRTGVWKNDETLWTEVIESYPKHYFAYFKRGVYRGLNGRVNEAFQDYNLSLQCYPEFNSALINRGMIYFQRKDYNNAIVDFNRILKSDDSNYKAYLNRGLCFLNAGELELARADLNRVIEIKPGLPDTYFNLALVYEAQAKYGQAIENYGYYIEAEAKNPSAFFRRGKLHLEMGDPQKAKNDFDQSLAIESRQEVFYYRFFARKMLGDKQGALADSLRANQAIN